MSAQSTVVTSSTKKIPAGEEKKKEEDSETSEDEYSGVAFSFQALAEQSMEFEDGTSIHKQEMYHVFEYQVIPKLVFHFAFCGINILTHKPQSENGSKPRICIRGTR